MSQAPPRYFGDLHEQRLSTQRLRVAIKLALIEALNRTATMASDAGVGR